MPDKASRKHFYLLTAAKSLPLFLAAAGLALCCPLLFPQSAEAAWRVAFMPLSYSLPDQGLRLDVGVWYPTESRRGASTIRLQDWKFSSVNASTPAKGPFPLVLMSHPTAGSRFSAHNIAAGLAAEGFVVAALTHPLDNIDHMPYVLNWDSFSQRTYDLTRLIDLILPHETLGPVINAARIGAVGFGSGATTVLLAGGALPDCSGWTDFCKDEPDTDRDPYCNKWAHERITTGICPRLPLTKSLADPRIKAVAAVVPRFPMLLNRKALRYFYPSLLLVTTENSRTSEQKALDSLARQFAIPPEHYQAKTDNVRSLLAECPENLRDDLPDMCLTVTREERQSLFRQFLPVLVKFFDTNLVSGIPRAIPAPPDLTPVVEKKKPGPEKKTSSRRARRRTE